MLSGSVLSYRLEQIRREFRELRALSFAQFYVS